MNLALGRVDVGEGKGEGGKGKGILWIILERVEERD
jgi:hypothetical protein